MLRSLVHPSRRILACCSHWRRPRLRPRLRPARQFSTRARAAQRAHLACGEPTIYALSTAPGRAAIAVIRVSGPAATKIYESLCPDKPLPRPRVAALRTLYDPNHRATSSGGAAVLDAGALVLYFPRPRTVTGEDVLELHLHGGPAIVRAVLRAIAGANGPQASEIRYAEPGEFTRRAFMNSRLDLPQIEALGDTLAAETEQQRRLAVRGGSDALSKRYEAWRQQLLYARGELEALIDFSEDQHFDESADQLVASVASQVRALQSHIALHIRNASRGELRRTGIKIALLGAPNAGKSSLLNQIVGKEAAIVSPEEGTTRDIVDVGVDLGGWFCKLGDMAGIRSQPRAHNLQSGSGSGSGGGDGQHPTLIGLVEQEGIRRARARALESDVVVVVLSIENDDDGDGGASSPQGQRYRLNMEPDVIGAANECAQAGKCLLAVINKCDRLPAADRLGPAGLPSRALIDAVQRKLPAIPAGRIFAISCHEARDSGSGEKDGLQTFLVNGLICAFKDISSPIASEHGGDTGQSVDASYWEDSLGVTHRQSSNLQQCSDQLEEFLAQVSEQAAVGPDIDIVTAAEHLRFAADALARITGHGRGPDVEEVLGVVFEKFCVGK